LSADAAVRRQHQRRFEAAERFSIVDRPEPIEHRRQRLPTASV
jgi:hypothetical protein